MNDTKEPVEDLDESVEKLKKMEPEVQLKIVAAKLALLVEEGNAKVDECLKAINDGNELIQKIREILRGYN